MPAITSPPETRVRQIIRVRGGVQGVGFRPFVFTLAARLTLSGLVGNDTDGVFIEVEGPAADLDRFVTLLRSEAPPMARIESVEVRPGIVTGDTTFRIVESVRRDGEVTPVTPDIAVCADCLTEMRTPGNRRFGYPFINCTNCGPRYTIITALPYDRAQTTMRTFAMCADCSAEYHDPGDRRYHAQPNACPSCGPTLSWCDGATGEVTARTESALARAQDELRAGRIVAVQGIGGFHIACRADDEAAVARLRARKHRPEKPLAVLVADLDTARTMAVISDAEAALLSSAAAPIVLLERRPDAPLAPSVAPGTESIGILLAYAPVHHLLVSELPLVFTSGNLADEPIAFTSAEAFARFDGLVDGVLFHDRPIHAPADDSVMRIALRAELPIRRSRGYAPYPVALPFAVEPVLAVGGELKATVCLTRGSHGFLSPHIGDVENLETERAMTRTASHLQQLFGVLPRAVAADLSPVYRSTVWASRFAAERGVSLVRVQHHHAHVASLMAEHGLAGDTRILGVAFDGTGHGPDGTVWGGEFLLADFTGFERVAHLGTTQLAGGDAAVRHPARLALAHLHAAGIPWREDLAPVRAMTPEALRVLRTQLKKQLQTHVTSSAGRLLDACASLAGGRQAVSYEGQAAIEFEALAMRAPIGFSSRYVLTLDSPSRGPASLTLDRFWRQVVDDVVRGRDRRSIALDVHSALADAIVCVARHVRETHGTTVVGLTGGVFQNVLLLTLAARRLRHSGFTVLTHRLVPPNDGGLALGQAMIAAAMRQQA